MKKSRLMEIFPAGKPVIGMVHLKALPGSPRYDYRKGMSWIIDCAVSDAMALEKGGISGIQIENQFDKPFLKPGNIGPETVAAVTAAATAIRKTVSIPIGINIHLNGVHQALAIAQAVGADWIRAFELANTYISNSGIIEAAGPSALRYRAFLNAQDIMIFGDFHVKHGSHSVIADRTLEEQAEDVAESGAEVLIITGTKTGSAPTKEEIIQIKKKIKQPVFIGSGFTLDNANDLMPILDGAIVGTYFKHDGKIENAVDSKRVKNMMEKIGKISA